MYLPSDEYKEANSEARAKEVSVNVGASSRVGSARAARAIGGLGARESGIHARHAAVRARRSVFIDRVVGARGVRAVRRRWEGIYYTDAAVGLAVADGTARLRIVHELDRVGHPITGSGIGAVGRAAVAADDTVDARIEVELGDVVPSRAVHSMVDIDRHWLH